MNDKVETIAEVTVPTVPKEHKFLVQINYKSGNNVTAWFDTFKIKQDNGNLSGIEWSLSSDQDGKNLIFIGIADIESVVQLGFEERN